MLSPWLQTIVPFFLSAFIVIAITIIAEKYGTKVGGIIGTLPSTIIIAFIFISLNKGITFASKAVAVVPAEMAINLFFLIIFSILAFKSLFIALTGSFTVWTILSAILYLLNISNIYLSLILYISSLIATFLILEKIIKIKSTGKVKVHYTTKKILFRGVLAGIVITTAVVLSNIGEVISGIFSIFPAIFTSTMIITYKEHGPDFSSSMAKSMIFGSPSVMSYCVSIHFLYPLYGIIIGTIISLIISIILTTTIMTLRRKIS